jgi:hypothetical protein
MRPISKSQFMQFLRHPRLFWDQRHNPEGLPPEDPMEAALSSQSDGVEAISRQLHPGGLMMDCSGDFAKGHEESLKALADGEVALFQPTFTANGLMARADILYRDQSGGFILREVKSSSPPASDDHVFDAAFQYRVLTEAGVPVSKVELLLLNREYVRDGQLDPDALFVPQDVTDRVIGLQGFVSSTIGEAKEIDSHEMPPEVGLEDLRIANLSDDEVLHYRPDLRKEDSVLLMPKSGVGRRKNIEIAAQLSASKGSVSVSGLDNEVLDSVAEAAGTKTRNGHPENTNKFKVAFRVATSTQAVICDSAKIAETISEIKFPVVFIDFETYLSALPPHDGCRPNDQVPFMASMIRIDSPDARAEVMTVIAEPDNGDPRKLVAQAVLDGCQGAACLVAFNAGFEKTVMRNLAKVLDEGSHDEMFSLVTKFKDIADPFRKGDFYHPEQYGKASLKRVAGVLLKKKPYEGLEIVNGASAAGVYLKALSGDTSQWEKAKGQLIKYCDADVQCMVDVLSAMENYAGLAKSEQRFRKHARIGVRSFGAESIIDADPRTVVHDTSKDAIDKISIDGRDMKKCSAAVRSGGFDR